MKHLMDKVDAYLCAHQDELIAQGRALQMIPEWGFCEEKTSAFVQKKWDELGLTSVKEFAGTGRMVTLKGKSHKANCAYLGELDGIYSPEHPSADPATGVSHACGHNIQINALLAVSEALVKTGVMEELNGDISLIAVPAEEVVPVSILEAKKAAGVIETNCGKFEMLRLGLFDDIDVLIGSHALENSENDVDRVMVNFSCHGLKSMEYIFRGRTAHSTVCPEKGINALNAAVNTINAINALREAFPPEEGTRVSYIITEGGHSVGNVPDLAVLEVIVATKSMAYLESLTEKIHHAARGAAGVIGCELEIRMQDQYLPYVADGNLADLICKNAEALTGVKATMRPHDYFSNDLGDVSQKIPTAQVVYGGFYGDLHNANFRVENEVEAYVLPARVTARALLDLLSGQCEKAIAIRENFRK